MQVKLFGITGKKASGKSSVAKIFRKNNIPIIDIDCLYNDMLKPGTKVHREIISCFDDDFLTNTGDIDLKKLSVALCEKAWIKKIVDDIMEEEICNFLERLINAFSFHKIDIAGIESGVILQTAMNNYIPTIIMVASDFKNRYNRLEKIIDKEVIDNLIALENKGSWETCDFLINNNDTLEDLEIKTTETIKDLLLFYKRNGRIIE